MIEHIVLFKWKEDASPDAIALAMNGLLAMKDQIPEILELSCGENFSQRSQGFQHGLRVQLLDCDALSTYADHPVHQEVIEKYIKPILGDIIAVDYEV
ncbi:MAG: Dabb family protein [Moorea sp. SIO4G2]|uniref:Dabb family protein n=1 Tax=Moorena sp. SIO3I6 TaxID=2607831 RepID=UPI0013F94162|nr:Dabb family protein [Moorena sp. SIO3I6]NEO60818.1 Dabb family protein [Moorena sp. SIO4G2]NEP25661.1 Dabb family protein [Moorena sp. SIO3I6]